MYTSHAKTLGELKNNIYAAYANLDADKLDKLDQSFQFRLSQCINYSGGRP